MKYARNKPSERPAYLELKHPQPKHNANLLHAAIFFLKTILLQQVALASMHEKKTWLFFFF